MMDEDWLMQFRVSDFTRTVWRYAHVLCCYEPTGRKILELAGDVRYASEPQVPRFYIYWPDGTQDDYGQDDVRNCSFGRHLEARGDARTYDIVYGKRGDRYEQYFSFIGRCGLLYRSDRKRKKDYECR
jgi:hypothetical protein